MPCLCNVETRGAKCHVFYLLTMTKLNTLQATSYFFGEGLSHINHSTYSTKTLGVFLYVYVYILLE